MNYHSNEWIMERVKEHYNEALNYFDENQIFGIFYQGSGNYGMDTENSDVDTKLLVLPTFGDIVFNHRPVSTTHVRENNEHIDFKDIREMFKTFRKMNINFIEILYTSYYIINPTYEKFWKELRTNRELIARYDETAAFKSMKGQIYQKIKNLYSESPCKIEAVTKYGYDPKELHHIVRFWQFMQDYFVRRLPYAECLQPETADFIKSFKTNPVTPLEASLISNNVIKEISKLEASLELNNSKDKIVDEKLDSLLYKLLKEYFRENLY